MAALPAFPNPEVQPIEPIRSYWERTHLTWFITMGYIGPRTTLIIETATDSPMRNGMS